jgi:hypothetical protein
MKILSIILILSVSSVELIAQTNNSPYSIFGVGDIDDSYYNRTTGMANTGLAYRSANFITLNNPASLSALGTHYIAGELAARGTLINYYGAGVNQNSNQSSDITFKKIIIGTKPTNHWGTSAGLVPFSSQNYEFVNPQPILGALNEATNAYYQGNGGLNKVYWANSYDFLNHISVGLEASYLFGSMQQKIILLDPFGNEIVSTNNTTNMTNGFLTYGLQFYTGIGKKWDVSIGGTFSNKTNLLARNTEIVLAPDSSQLYNAPKTENYFTLPTSYGLGIAITRNKRYTLVADYKFQNWSALNYSGYNYVLTNSSRYSVGFEISKQKNLINNLLFETSFYQFGAYYNKSYVQVFDQQLKDIGGSVGIGINSKHGVSYTVTFQYGVKGIENTQLLKQHYGSLTFIVSLRDALYNTRKVRFL